MLYKQKIGYHEDANNNNRNQENRIKIKQENVFDLVKNH